MTMPLMVLGILIVGVAADMFNKMFIKGISDKKVLFANFSMVISATSMLLYIMYLYLTREMMDVFVCAPTTPPDGNLYLTSVMEKCTYPPTGTQATLLPLAIIALFFYTTLYPIALGSFLFKYRETAMEDQLLRAKGVGNEVLTNPNALWMRKLMGRAYFQFKPDFFYWVLVILGRKCAIAVTAAFNRNPAFQMAACLLIIFLAYSVQVQIRPYLSPGEYDAVLKLHEARAATDMMQARLKVAIANIATQTKKKSTKNVMSVQGTVDKKALMGLMGSVLLNYNTVEAVMLFSTAIVCVLALMFVVRLFIAQVTEI
jgi:hypothetical protein